jgi:hypothetical protein
MLELDKTADPGEVSSTFRKVSLKFHPDKTHDPAKIAHFKELSEAYTDYVENGDAPGLAGGGQPQTKDGGIGAGTYAVIAITAGLVNVTVDQLLADHTFTKVMATVGLCYWDGKAPVCMPTACPPGYDYIRHSQGWVGDVDMGFGARCLIGPNGGKYRCCRASIGDNSWAGSWENAWTGDIYHCSYWKIGRCGQMDCHIGIHRFKVDIDGEDGKCNEAIFPGIGGRRIRGVWAAGVIQFPWHPVWGDKFRLVKIH